MEFIYELQVRHITENGVGPSLACNTLPLKSDTLTVVYGGTCYFLCLQSQQGFWHFNFLVYQKFW